MGRIAGRAWIVWILVLAMTVGMVFFYTDYSLEAENWVMSVGSEHVYEGTKLKTGIITDRDGNLLLNYSEKGVYAADETVRKATLHWVGDREGNISIPLMTHYASEMVNYSILDGVYSYADTVGQLRLTLDADVQAAALEAMGEYFGTVAVYNYKSGEILCAVTTPTFDPDNLPDIAGDTTGQYDGAYLNRFVRSVYIPGSIFKIVTLSAALESIPDITEQTFVCASKYYTDPGVITCEYSHKTQSLKRCFANSCNCSFAQISRQLGSEKLMWYVEQFGVLESVSFDGFTTAKGNVQLEDVTDEELCWTGIGQFKDQINICGFLRFLGAIANDGVGVEPYVVSEITVGNETTYEAPVIQRSRIMSETTAQTVKEYMNNNVNSKYGPENFPGLTVCGKSGTAEVGGGREPNGMFAGFLLDEEYPLAFIAAVEGGGYGTDACIPVLSKVLAACTEAMDN